MTIKKFIFNSFQLNTYVVYDSSGECVIIDAGNSNKSEDQELFDFIAQEKLVVKALCYTHAHVDHIVGNNSIINKYKIQSIAHQDSLLFFKQASNYGTSLGFDITSPILPAIFINEGDDVSFGHSKLKVIHTPGHANGSVCYYSENDQFVVVGDVLFKGSIGRTDLPTGDFDLLSRNIIKKLYILPNGVKVYSGHGPSTTIGYEKIHNPFVNLLEN